MGKKRNARDAIDAALKKRKWSGRELGRRLGVQGCTVSRWRTGKRTPERELLLKLGKLLGIPATLLLEWS